MHRTAAEKGNLEILVWTLSRVPELERDLKYLFLDACQAGALDLIKYLAKRYGERCGSLADGFVGCKTTKKVLEYFLFGLRVDVNHFCKGFTALYFAATVGDEETAKFLIAQGAHPDLEMKGGGTAFWVACSNGHLGVAKLLLANGARWDVKKERISAFCESCRQGRLDVVVFFLDVLKVDVNEMNAGRSPLLYAMEEQQEEVVDFLRKRGGEEKEDHNPYFEIALGLEKLKEEEFE